jgi:hypothetical protein
VIAQQESSPPGFRFGGQGTSPDDGIGTAAFLTDLTCDTEVTWFRAWLVAAETIFSPTRRLMKRSDHGEWDHIYDAAVVALDDWSRPGTYSCFAGFDAYDIPGGRRLGGNQSGEMTSGVSNPRCGCMPGTHNRAFTRTRSISFSTEGLRDAPEYADAMGEAGTHWNEALNQSVTGIGINIAPSTGGVPVVLAPIDDQNVAAWFTNIGGPERIEWDPEFLGRFNADVLHHLAAHEIGHALGAQHGGCSQTATEMFNPVNLSGQVIGVSAPLPDADKCTIRSEYGPYTVVF